jgi:AraC family transcriptional activator of pobA
MSREQNDARPFAIEVLDALAAQMSVWLRRALIAHPEEPRPPAAERLVRAYAALIERHLGKGLSVADHARSLGVTPTHLTRTCRRLSGLSAADLLTQRSLHAARRLFLALHPASYRAHAVATAQRRARPSAHETGSLTPLTGCARHAAHV